MLRRFFRTETFEQRLAIEAARLKEEANGHYGEKREALLRKARQTEIAAHLSEWIRSPGLTADAQLPRQNHGKRCTRACS